MIVDGLAEVAPRDMSEHSSFGNFNTVFSWQKIEIIKDSTDERKYRRMVKILRD